MKTIALVSLFLLTWIVPSRVLAAAGPTAVAAQKLPPHVPGELLVKFKDGLKGPESQQALQRLGFSVIQDFEHIGWTQIKLPPGVAAADALRQYPQDPAISAAELNAIQTNVCDITPEPNDPGYAADGRLGTWSLANIHAPEAWRVTAGSSNVVIASTDTGINYNHEDLAANMWHNPNEIPGNGVDDDQNGYVDDIFGADMVAQDGDPMGQVFTHGSATSGMIGAVGDNGKGLTGVAWKVKLLAVRIIKEDNTMTTSGEVAGMNYLVEMAKRGIGLRAVNMSYGYYYSTAAEDGIKALAAADVLAVCAAGNNNANNDNQPIYPASYNIPNVISVAASDSSDQLASFSNYGKTTVELAAPGDLVPTVDGSYDTGYMFNGYGTSFAAPCVAGAVALLASAFPDATSQQIKDWILSSVDVLPAFTNKTATGGRLNVARAMQRGLSAQAAQAPVVVFPPLSQVVKEGSSITLLAGAGGTPPLSYQWSLNRQDLVAECNPTLVIGAADTTHAGTYTVTISNAWGTVTERANLAVRTSQEFVGAPVFLKPLRNLRAVADKPATLDSTVSGSEPLSYVWLKNGAVIPGQTGAALALPTVKSTDEAEYQVVVSNRFGVAESRRATLWMMTPPLFVWGAYAPGEYAVPASAEDAIDFSAGANHGLFLTLEGTVQSWGGGPGAQIPAGLSNVVSVAGNLDASYALTSDGLIYSWGISVPGAGELIVPNSKGPFFAVVAGAGKVLALGANGSVISWGSSTDVPAGLSNVVAISTSRKYSMALKSDGTVVAWDALAGNEPPGLTNVIAIKATPFFELALREDGTVSVWGDTNAPAMNMPPGLSNVVAITGGVDNALALKEDGTLISWGASVSDLDLVPAGLDHIVELGEGQTCFIARQGSGKLLPPAPLDGPGLLWVTDEALPWIPETSVTHDSVDALQSPALRPGQRSGVRTKVLGPGLLRYWFKLSSDAEPLSATMEMDGAVQAHLTPGSDWQQISFDVPPGNHTLEWACAGPGTTWLDQFSYLPAQTLGPCIVVGPSNAGTLAGSGCVFSVTALGQPLLSYQWQTNGVDIPGATGSSLAFGNAQLGHNGLLFSVVITNAYGSVTSAPAMLSVGRLPILVQNIVPLTVAPGQSVTLSFVATNGSPGPFTFEWLLGTNIIFTETRDDLISFCTVLQPVQNYYRVTITSPVGTARFPAVPLTIGLDADNDGMLSSWEFQMGLNPSSANDRDLDTDGDGLSNYQEYIAGTCPTNAMDYLRLAVGSMADNGCIVQFTNSPGRTYTVQWTDSLAPSAAWRKLADVPASLAAQQVRINDASAPGASARYYRLVTPRVP